MVSKRKRILLQKSRKLRDKMESKEPSSEDHPKKGYAEVLKTEFPSLSNNAQMNSSGQANMWSSTASRNLGSGPVPPRNQSTPLSAQNTQEELFTPTSARQGGFRFGTQNSGGAATQAPSNPADDFPPLNRNANGEIGGERGVNLMPSLGFGNQASGAAAAIPPSRGAGNGLLNALSANSRTSDDRSPTAASGQGQSRSQEVSVDDSRQKGSAFRDEASGDSPSQSAENRNPLGAIGNDSLTGKGKEEKDGQSLEVQDPLAGLAPIDKFGLKGLRMLMTNYPSYGALMQGMDPNEFGLNVNSSELISTQIYSLFDDTPPRPAIPNVRLPECYKVTNVQPIETKIPSFNEETLFWIFYSCPQDIKQHLAAQELHTRNWRWHKKLHFWLTKDELMMPASLGPNHERGYYIIWDTISWRKERRELTLHYGDLETNLAPAA
ncbi:General negative regulator of transcription subunit 2 [Colletotrichum gloeosporioides]|uniref:General negative regulator of transcription subunit 2 n=1 Tax=Colletotrichum gloeosporioides TaxID=474922 RepID=A0A8H4FRC5_COLGL|nr:General negative regulator of transcription subunit 2 [Colletotrichum gloeosporioides]KAF3811655.1 General negative regulator of transcription subunit 2 [Colletotrichum gloeosporioides]